MRRADPQLKVRFPGDLKQRLAEAAAKNSRSLNSEIVLRRSAATSSPATSDHDLIVEIYQELMSWKKMSSFFRPGPPDPLSMLPTKSSEAK
jgi:hypothetical protein